MKRELCYRVKLDHLGSLVVHGQDAQTFLQGQLSCDLNDLTSKRFLLGAHCNIQGKVVSLFRLNLWNNQFFLTTEQDCLSSSAQKLSFFKLRAQVKIDTLDSSFKRIGLLGSEAKAQLEKTLHIKAPSPFSNVEHASVLITALPGPTPRFELLGPEPAITALEQNWDSLPQADHSLWHYCDIEAKIPWLSPKTQGLFFAHELGLYELEAISLKKGCYLGQEIIARVYYKGKPKRTLYLVDPTAAGFKLDKDLHQLLDAQNQSLGDLICYQNYHDSTLCLAICSINTPS